MARDEGQIVEVPWWEFKRVYRQDGVRLAKFVPFQPPVHRSYQSSMLPAHYLGCGPAMSAKVDENAKTPHGNLPKAEYRYWFGKKEKYFQMAKCRACRTTLVSEGLRSRHLQSIVAGQQERCSVRLNRAFKRLLAQKKCVICRAHTTKQKWGVPICEREMCLSVWMFRGDIEIPALTEALR